MTDKATLEARLRDLVSAGLAGPDGRVLRAASPRALLARLLREIDRSIMARNLRVETASGRSLTILAANGRLDGLADGTPATLLSGLEGGALDASDPELPGRILTCLEALLDGETLMRIDDRPPAGVVDRTSAGPSAEALAKAWDIALAPRPEDEPVAAFLEEGKALMTGWIRTDMDLAESEASGDDAMVEALGDAANSLLDLIADAPEGWDVIALGAAGSDDLTAVLRAGDAVVLAGLPRASLGGLADLWRGAMGRL